MFRSELSMKQDHLSDATPSIIRQNIILFSFLLLIIGLFTGMCCGDELTSESACIYPDPLITGHMNDTKTIGESGSVISEKLESATLVLTHPPDSDRIPYTKRNFSPSIEASITWWMDPDFMDNTNEFRSYQRASLEKKKTFDTEKQIFYHFIQNSLDTAENGSVLGSNQILFRAISPNVTRMILNNSEYREDAYASTTYDPVACLDIVRKTDTRGFHNLLVLERKTGEHTLFINEDQREYLIPRESYWQVIKAVDIDNLTIKADFTLYNRTNMTDTFENIKLIYITPIQRDNE